MKYDDASWHYGGDFPADLPIEAGGTHIAMFLAWGILNGLAGEIHSEDPSDLLAKLRSRDITPGAWFFAACDRKFGAEDLNDEGNAFAHDYYREGDGLRVSPGGYIADYAEAFPTVPTLYSVADSWATFDQLTPILDGRFSEWKSSN